MTSLDMYYYLKQVKMMTKKSGVEKSGIGKFMVEKSGVEMSFNQLLGFGL